MTYASPVLARNASPYGFRAPRTANPAKLQSEWKRRTVALRESGSLQTSHVEPRPSRSSPFRIRSAAGRRRADDDMTAAQPAVAELVAAQAAPNGNDELVAPPGQAQRN